MKENDMQKPADFFSKYQETAFKKDVAGMISLYDEDVEVFDMWERGYFSGLEEWAAVITGWLTSLNEEKVNVIFELINIHESDEIAFAHALIQYQAIAAGGNILRSMKNRISIGLINKNGAWKVKHQHTSAPVDSTLKAILDI